MAETESNSRRPNRRRSRSRAAIDRTVPSPCVAVCAFDGQAHCRGCKRTADEIRNWMIMTREQKLEVLERIRNR
ncbi:MAG: DUF1289 domain-containing protein [Pseudomonadota bacterium]